MSWRPLVPLALALTVAAGAARSEEGAAQTVDPDPYRLERHQRAFPAMNGTLDLRRLASEARTGQLEALHALLAQDQERPIVVDLSASWCRPCRLAWPKVAQHAREREDLRFVLLTLERDDPDVNGLRHYVRSRWNAGAGLRFPSYALLDGKGEALTDRMRLDVDEAVSRLDELLAEREAEGGEPSPGGESLAELLAEHERRPVSVSAGSLGDYLDAVSEATGIRFVAADPVRAFELHLDGRQEAGRTTWALIDRFELRHSVLRPGGGLPPIVALWPRPGGFLDAALAEPGAD